MAQSVVLSDVTFTYNAMDRPLFRGLTLSIQSGWTGIVGANGAGKTTLLSLACGRLEASEGSVDGPADALLVEQRTDDPPDGFQALLVAQDGKAHRLRGELALGDDWLARWSTLSHGERKRAQIGVAMWVDPGLVALDEPTNHIDSQGRDLLLQALQQFRGVGLLVSHDRELLERLCARTLFLDPPHAHLRNGGYSAALRELEQEQQAVRKEHGKARKAIKNLKREAASRRDEASRSHARRSKKGLALKDHDGRAKKNLARVTGKDGQAGKSLRQLDGRLSQAREKMNSLDVRKVQKSGIWLPGSVSKRNRLLDLPETSIPVGDRVLTLPNLAIGPTDRIAFTGANGKGKSTFLRHVYPLLNVDEERLTFLPQEIDRAASRTILDEVRALPPQGRGHVFTVVSRLGSRPERLLESAEPSPGEIRKVALALGISRKPHLVVMDEPTNHLDLPSIECLEDALEECPCALLLVSHDPRFLDRLTSVRWHIESSGDGYRLSVSV